MASVRTRRGRHTALYRDADGRQRSAGTFGEYEEAEKAARVAEGRVAAGAEPVVAPGPESTVPLEKDGLPTLAGYAPGYLEDHGFSDHAQSSYRSILCKHIIPEFGHLTFPEITRSLVRSWLRALEKDGRRKHSTLQKIKVVASSITESAIEDFRETGAEDNPFRGGRVNGGSSPRRRVLTDDELTRICKYLDEPWVTRVELVAMTGMRIEEVMGLESSDIRDVRINVYRVLNCLPHGFREKPRTKTGEPRVVKVTPEMSRRLRSMGPGRIFPPITHSDFWDMWNRAVRSAGLDWEPQPRDVRHAFAEWARQGGAPLDKIRVALGHTNLATTDNYLGECEEDSDDALAAVMQHRKRGRAA